MRFDSPSALGLDRHIILNAFDPRMQNIDLPAELTAVGNSRELRDPFVWYPYIKRAGYNTGHYLYARGGQ